MSGRRKNNGSNTDGQDLVHLLSAEQRGEFMILASTITERMRNGIGEAFEAVEKREVLEEVEAAVASSRPGGKGAQGLEMGEKGEARKSFGFEETAVGSGKRGLKSEEKEYGEMKEVLPEPMEYTPRRPPAGKKVAKMVGLSKNPLEEDLPSGVGELSIIDSNPRGESPINSQGEEFGDDSGDRPLEVLHIAHHGGEDSDGELQLLAPEPIEYFPEVTTKKTQKGDGLLEALHIAHHDRKDADGELQILAPEPIEYFPEAVIKKTQKIQAQVDVSDVPLAGSPAVATPSPVPGFTAAATGKTLPPRKKPIAKRAITPKLHNLRRKAFASHDEWAMNVLHRIGEALNAPGGAKSTNTRLGPQGQVLKWPEIYKPVPTPLKSPLPLRSAKLVTQAVLLLLLSLEKYDARSRTFLLILASSLRVPVDAVIELESETAKTLIAVSKQMSADAESKKRADEGRVSRRWKVGLASVAGAAVIGVTGGLAAPFVAAGIGGLLSGVGLGATAVAGYLGAVAGSGAIMGALFGAYGGKMTGEMVERYAAEVKDFAFVPLRKSDPCLRVTIGITGWLTDHNEVILPWKALNENSEVYALRWEMDALIDLGSSLQEVLKSYAWSYVKLEIIKRTVLASLWAAIWPVALIRAARVIDNPFSIAKHRSEKAGQVLADAIINKAQGERPVTLIGFSLGARVIYYCLQSLIERSAYGLVENVVLMGAPVPSSGDTWTSARTVVAGRIVNVFSEKDYILGFLYRTSSVQFGIAGLQSVQVPGIENFDVSNRVEGHLRYRHVVGVILREIFGHDVDVGEVGKEEEVLKALELKDEQIERERKEREKDGGRSRDIDGEIDNALERAERGLEERKTRRKEEGVRRERREVKREERRRRGQFDSL